MSNTSKGGNAPRSATPAPASKAAATPAPATPAAATTTPAAPAAPVAAPTPAPASPAAATTPAPNKSAEETYWETELAQLAANKAAEAAKAAATPAPGPRPLSGPMAKLLAMAQASGVTSAEMKAVLPMKAAPPQTQVMARLAKQVGGIVAMAPNSNGRGNSWFVVGPNGNMPAGAVPAPAYRSHPVAVALAKAAQAAKA